ncbi:ankyrin repeat and SOCS box protein 3 [Genypterus blacodes]|uniref:ankyrin repeat and SOCS box protein 3 n=1 Tax=Genypterus blacodes TaxID=154954 RepID=UPI003F75F96E
MDFTECYTDTVSSVAMAARTGCWEKVRSLINRGMSVDIRDNRGWNALHEAVAYGNKECVREILKAAGSGPGFRAYVNSVTHQGESPCYLAARRGHVAMIRLLVASHANVNQLTNNLSSPLYAAVNAGYKDAVEFLISQDAEVNRIHTASCWTCLHQAVYKDHIEVVGMLVKVCDLEALDDHKVTPLFLAAQYGRMECLEILFSAGANVNAQAADLATPLMIASQEGHEACVDFLLDHSADPNIACSQDWPQLPIHAAAEAGHNQILRKLIPVSDRACDRGEGMVSPLYVAVHSNQSQTVELLLSEGYSPDAQDCTHILSLQSPLCLALTLTSDHQVSECVRLLVVAGATLDEESWTYALATDKTELLGLILEHRWIPSPQHFNKDGSAPNSHTGETALNLQELRDLLCVALNHVHFAACWLPVLLNAGLEPSLLLQHNMMEQAESGALNYLLEFVNWAVLPLPLKHVLERRKEQKTWMPSIDFDSVPSLSHLCRLQVRTMLDSHRLMMTDVVSQLPVPSLLHRYLHFSDVEPSSYTHSSPATPVSYRIDGYQNTHQHIHVL